MLQAQADVVSLTASLVALQEELGALQAQGAMGQSELAEQAQRLQEELSQRSLELAEVSEAASLNAEALQATRYTPLRGQQPLLAWCLCMSMSTYMHLYAPLYVSI